jgi:O-Antigen ligase
MTAEKIRQALYRTILLGGICGFEIAAGLTSLADALSTPASIAVRLFVASCALTAVMLDSAKAFVSSRRLILGYCLFWYLYLMRIAYATTLSTEQLAFEAWYYYSWSIGACALPMLGISLWSPRYQDADRNFVALFAALIIGGLLASFGASSIELNQNNELVETGRLQLVALNPILLGQLGATLAVMAVWVLTNRFKSYGLSAKFIFLAAALVGAGLLIGANSRGPLVSAVVCLLFISLVSGKRSRLYAMTLFAVAIISFVPVTQYVEAEFGISTYTRLFGQSQLTEENTLDRFSRYDSAINNFMNNSLFGSSLEEPKHGGYPHNVFIEAMMATGIFGFSLLLVLMVTTFVFAFKLYVSVPGYGWASVLFIQYLVAAQFSGAIYTVNYLWITAGLVIAIYASLAPRTSYRNIRHTSLRQRNSTSINLIVYVNGQKRSI